MDESLLYFAYGSNMSVERLTARIPSARLLGPATLAGHALRFDKPGSRDGTGKCDACPTGLPGDKVMGALYSIAAGELSQLDAIEGAGRGYERLTVNLGTPAGRMVRAETYVATRHEPGLRPFDWYKEHVLRGARSLGLPSDYVARIECVAAASDPDAGRRARELAIYRDAWPA